MHFKNLFSPICIGDIKVKNRLVMPAMSVNFGVNKDGYVNDQLTEYFISRSKNGTGMIVVGGGGIDTLGHELPFLPSLWNKNCISDLARMVKRIKKFGTKIGMQLMHGGRQTYNKHKEAPSSIPSMAVVKEIPVEIRIKRIKELIESFGNSANYCMEAGFDFIEIHAAHGYLIGQFLSLISNNRKDKYGNLYYNRIRFLIEIVENIRIKTLHRIPIGIRINGDDFVKNVWNINDCIKLSILLGEKKIDYLSVSAGIYGSNKLTIPSMYENEGCFVNLAKKVKKRIKIPVITVGRIRNPEISDLIICKKESDMIAMGRAHLADHELAKKANLGRSQEIRPCIGCCLGCIDRVLNLESATCVVNPEVGNEIYHVLSKKIYRKYKKILIVGAGISGLIAANELVLAGNKVIIVDKNLCTGGTAKVSSYINGRKNIIEIIKFFEDSLNNFDVEIRLNSYLSKKLIHNISPDKIVVAIGSKIRVPTITGIARTSMTLHHPVEIIKRRTTLNRSNIIFGERGTALFLADFLLEKGEKAIILSRKKHLAEDLARNDRFYLIKRLNLKKIKIYKNISRLKILNNGVSFFFNKKQLILKNYDGFIIAEKYDSVNICKDVLKKISCEVYIIGDARIPGNIMASVIDGKRITSLI